MIEQFLPEWIDASLFPVLFLAIITICYAVIQAFRPPASLSALGLVPLFVISGFLWLDAPDSPLSQNSELRIDGFSRIASSLICLLAGLNAFLGKGHEDEQGISEKGDYFALSIFSVLGATLLVCSNDFITAFIALELLSLPLYCMCGAALLLKSSSESAFKYFSLGAFGAAFFLFGSALIYGSTGSTNFSLDSAWYTGVVRNGLAAPALIGMLMVLVGISFKIGLVPFHSWLPDVYQGAPRTTTMFMGSVIKVAGVLFAARLCIQLFPHTDTFITTTIWYLAFASMVLGNLLALRQRSVVRMLAYSSIAHSGYLALGFLGGFTREVEGFLPIIFYVSAYAIATIAALGVVQIVGKTNDDINSFSALGRRHPLLAAIFALALLSMAGLPPALSGLLSKVFIFMSAVEAGYVGLVVVAAVCSVVSIYYYLRVISAMYFLPYLGEGDGVIAAPKSEVVVLAFCGASVVLMGILARPISLVIDSFTAGAISW